MSPSVSTPLARWRYLSCLLIDGPTNFVAERQPIATVNISCRRLVQIVPSDRFSGASAGRLFAISAKYVVRPAYTRGEDRPARGSAIEKFAAPKL